ncbi:sensor histidine kinase [Nesterenkonia muleiensis]|uniref:sensor histidine kinase n=1 Tax=Nesterenkonia muleiensis TaxID=2282648 RepID=UPI000E76EEC3|nr:histidine kinase [Nesterenkonia muleiensis]
MGTETTLNEPVLRKPRIARWFAARPRILDALVILACVVPTVLALVLVPPDHAWLGYLCAAGVAAAFWWRRSHPLPVLLIAVGFAALNPISWASTSVATFESFFGVYALAAGTKLRTAILGYLISEAVIFAVSGVALLLEFRGEFPAVFLQPGALIALAIGVAVRANRSRGAALEDVVAMREERAAAAERARITAEMHDVLAHSVTVIIALAGGAHAGWEKHPERARNALEQLGTVGAQTLEEVQRILRVLREGDGTLDAELERSGYNLPSLQELVDVFRAAGLPVTSNWSEAAIPTEPTLRTTVYRIVQESLTNALRYAKGATYVEVSVQQRDDDITVTVTDNGNPAPSPPVGAGVGLRAMRERAAAFHGSLTAGALPTSDGAPGSGWRICATLPVERGGCR